MAKPRTGKFVNCLNCDKSFYIPMNRFQSCKYCSRRCLALQARVEIERNCAICNKLFHHISSRANKAKYCSNRCKYIGWASKKNGTAFFNCLHCGKEFRDCPSVKRKYCSKECVGKSHKTIFLPKFTTIRRMMLARNMIQSCQKCGYCEHPEILGIHHIDRNRQNNVLENLEILCPMCHSLAHRKHISH